MIDRALYLPESWTADPARCAAAAVPAATAFTTKPKLGLAMLQRALAAGVPCAWVTGDSVYGADSALRRWLERQPCGYVLAVTRGQQLGLDRVEDWAERVAPDGWQRLSAGDGAKGPRLYDWAYLPYSGAPPGWHKGWLMRRSLAEPEEVTFYLSCAPEATTLAELVRVAGARWTIEACFEAAKSKAGLDQYEVRSWTGWHRHITLALLAQAYLSVVRHGAVGGTGAERSAGRPLAPHRARSAPPALAGGLGTAARPLPGDRLVALAPPAPTARAPKPLETTDPTP